MMAEQVVTTFLQEHPSTQNLQAKRRWHPRSAEFSVRDIDNKDHLQWRLLILEENHDQQYRQSKKTANLTQKI